MKTDDIPKFLWIGRRDIDWYEDCTTTLVELFGQDDLKLTASLFAATSINTSLKSNVTLFRRAYHEYKNDLPIGRYLPNIQQQLQYIREGKELSGRKINSFARAMSGDPDAVVVDVWILRAFGFSNKTMRHTGAHKGQMREGGATKKQYDVIEEYIRTEAKQMGLQPRQFCAAIWGGIRTYQTGEKDTRYSMILKREFNNLFTIKL